MTNLELAKQVAEAMGWKVWEYTFTGGPTVIDGIPPGGGNSCRVPNWPEDLPACMRDLWPWLKQQGTEMTLESNCDQTAWSVAVVPHPRANWAKSETLAICHAVLAVAEKLKEQSDGRS